MRDEADGARSDGRAPAQPRNGAGADAPGAIPAGACDDAGMRLLEALYDVLLDQRLEEALAVVPARRHALVKIALTNAHALFASGAVAVSDEAFKGLVGMMRYRLPFDVSLSVLPEYVFALLMEAQSEAEVRAKLRPLEEVLAAPLDTARGTVWLSHAIGVAMFNSTARLTPEELRARARLALHEACRQGVGSVSFYRRALSHRARRASRGEQLIRAALSEDGVLCFLQPIVDLREGERVVAFEALMRLRDAERNVFEPANFIEVAESTALIDALSQRLTEQALRVLGDACFARRFGRRFSVNVNLSRQQLLDAELAERLLATVARQGVDARRLQIEVTESSVLAEPHAACRNLQRLRAAGIRVALDDFGSGYSALAQLCDLPLDSVKIDRGLVRGVEREPRKRHVLAAVIALCKRLGFGVVVEGVENHSALAAVRELGAEQVQGFIYSRPISIEATLVSLRPRMASGAAPG